MSNDPHLPTKREQRANVPWEQWPADDVDRVIQMAWEDRTPFEAIEWQFGLKENDVRALMRKFMKRSSFEMWRKRVKGRATKHGSTRTEGIKRFKSQNQKG